MHWNGECKNRVGILDLSMSSVCCCSKELQNFSDWYTDIQVCMFLGGGGGGGGCFVFCLLFFKLPLLKVAWYW